MRSLDDLAADLGFTKAKTGAERTIASPPDPEGAPRRYTVISVDDHIVEPPDTFEGRVPAKLADRAPRVVDKDDGSQTWVYDGEELPNIGSTPSSAARSPSTASSRCASSTCAAARGT